VSLREWFGGKEEPWWQLASRHPIEVFDRQTGEVHEIKPGQSDPGEIEGLLTDFRYVDAQGKPTRRSILCWQCREENGIIYVTGYCPFREDFRTFRADRMKDVVETRSGRHVGNNEILAYFAAYAHEPQTSEVPLTIPPHLAEHIAAKAQFGWTAPSRQEMQADAIRRQKAHRARRDCIAGLRVLVYIAMADDVVTEEEANVEASYLEAWLAMIGAEHDVKVTEWLLDSAAALAVPPRSLTIAVNAVAKDREYFRLVLDCALRLIEVEGDVSTLARNALESLMAAGTAAGWLAPASRA
jgi:hypothetical protein